MNNLIIKQLSKKVGYEDSKKRSNSISRYDFCKSKKWGTQDKWLLNKYDNGYSYEETEGLYLNFKLELIK